MTIRLVATDLDGTFFDHDHYGAARTVAALNAVHDLGLVTVAITGRSHFKGIERATCTGARFDWFVGSNGAHRVNVASGELVEQLCFSEEELAETVAKIRERFPKVGFGFEFDDGLAYDEPFIEYFPLGFDGGPRVDTSAEQRPGTVGKFFVALPTIDVLELIAAVGECVPDGAQANTGGGLAYVEVTPAGADKGSALQRLCTELDITADEVIAFGDNRNDLTMLEWAGRSVAMANAVEPARKIADEVTERNDDFGVAIVLEQLAADIGADRKRA